MIVSTTDPITLVDVQNPESHPFVIEGDGDNMLKIYFDNEENRLAYLGSPTACPEEGFEINLDNSE